MLRNRPTRSFWFFCLLRAGVALILLALPSTIISQTSISKKITNVGTRSKGEALFESSCAVCHGLDGGGGEHAPSIGRASAAKSLTNSDLGRILHDGVPAKGMPAFNTLGDLRIRSILSYLRFLEGKTEVQTDTGNPNRGKEVFFGKGQCANCHAIGGNGHFLSTDLSDYAYDHNSNEIRAAIVRPQEQAVTTHSLVNVTTGSGLHVSGFIRNENSSSLQIQNADGQFYLFLKSDLGPVERLPAPAMPGDYKQQLNAAEIEDLVSYIVHQSPVPKATATQHGSHKK